jgi:predicted Rossmann-fold nucleotide-binding protein
MHHRKDTMYRLGDGFVALPGGIGTLEELMEIYTWQQLWGTTTSRSVCSTRTNIHGHLVTFSSTANMKDFLGKEKPGCAVRR